MAPLYKVSAPDEYLAITGLGINLVKITKADWVWPFQRFIRFRYGDTPCPLALLPGA